MYSGVRRRLTAPCCRMPYPLPLCRAEEPGLPEADSLPALPLLVEELSLLELDVC